MASALEVLARAATFGLLLGLTPSLVFLDGKLGLCLVMDERGSVAMKGRMACPAFCKELGSLADRTFHVGADNVVALGHTVEVVLDNGGQCRGVGSRRRVDWIANTTPDPGGWRVDIPGCVGTSSGSASWTMRSGHASAHGERKVHALGNDNGRRAGRVVDEQERGVRGKGRSVGNIPEGINGLFSGLKRGETERKGSMKPPA